MKRTLHKLLALTCGAFLLTTANAQSKVGVIDLKKVFDGYFRTKQADVTLKDRAADFDKARNGLLEDYKKASEDFKKLIEAANDQAVSADERDKRKKDLEKKQSDLRDQENSIRTFDQNSRQSLGEQQQRMRESVLRDIRGVLEEKARGAGYQLVLDTAAVTANQTPVIMFTTLSGSENDLSDVVLKQLNATAPPEGAKAEEKKDDKKDEKKEIKK
jgi:Skp family chaperone for outer membrane proteins